MRTRSATAVAVVVLILFAAIVIARGPGRTPSTTLSSTTSTGSTIPSISTSSSASSGSFARGLGFTPASFDQKGMLDYFATAGQAGSIITWAGDWETLSDSGSAPFVLEAQAQQHNLTLLPELQVLNASSGELLRPLNSTNEAAYKALAVSFASTYAPPYMALGIEVNILYEHSPSDFSEFASFFNSTSSAIKQASPSTAVFTIFQLEKMKGLNGGLFGGTNDTSSSEWNLLSDFPSSDLAGFTTYPGLVFHRPSDIPASYYLEIAQHTQKPVAFTEVGWQSGTLPGWDNNESSQAGFVHDFFSLTRGIPKAVVVWAFAYDQGAAAPFNSMGLIGTDGAPKQAWEAWLQGGQ